jgi:hypothetical protein
MAASNSATTPLVVLRAGQQGIAEELALSRVTVNRALQQLVPLSVAAADKQSWEFCVAGQRVSRSLARQVRGSVTRR